MDSVFPTDAILGPTPFQARLGSDEAASGEESSLQAAGWCFGLAAWVLGLWLLATYVIW